jgi:hypothetical protein
VGLGAPHGRIRDPRRAARRDRLQRGRRRVRDLAGRDRPAAGADRSLGGRGPGRREELLAHGRDRAVRSVQRDPLRSRPGVQRGTGVYPGPLGDLSALGGDLEPGLHGVRPAAGRHARPTPVQQRRHGDGARAARQRHPAGPVELRHGPVHANPRADAGTAGPRPRRVRGRAVQLPGDRRPLAGRDVPDRRRRAALQRGSRLRAAPHHPACRAPRPPPREARAVPGPGRGGRRRDHEGGLPVPRRAARPDRGRDPPRGGPVRTHARLGHRDPGGGPGGSRRVASLAAGPSRSLPMAPCSTAPSRSGCTTPSASRST